MKRITLRLPDDLGDAIEIVAKENDRSLNAEIVRAIKAYLKTLKIEIEQGKEEEES